MNRIPPRMKDLWQLGNRLLILSTIHNLYLCVGNAFALLSVRRVPVADENENPVKNRYKFRTQEENAVRSVHPSSTSFASVVHDNRGRKNEEKYTSGFILVR